MYNLVLAITVLASMCLGHLLAFLESPAPLPACMFFPGDPFHHRSSLHSLIDVDRTTRASFGKGCFQSCQGAKALTLGRSAQARPPLRGAAPLELLARAAWTGGVAPHAVGRNDGSLLLCAKASEFNDVALACHEPLTGPAVSRLKRFPQLLEERLIPPGLPFEHLDIRETYAEMPYGNSAVTIRDFREVEGCFVAGTGRVGAIQVLGLKDTTFVKVAVPAVFRMQRIPAHELSGILYGPADFIRLSASEALGMKPAVVELVEKLAIHLRRHVLNPIGGKRGSSFELIWLDEPKV